MSGLSLRWGLTQALVRDYARVAVGRRASAAATPAVAEEKKPGLLDEWAQPYWGKYDWPAMPKDFKEHPERDLVNFPHPEMPKYPSKVRFAVLPDSWFQFFYPKTGATGGYVFGAGFATFMLSKEFLVITPEWLTLPSLILVHWVATRLFGHKISQGLDDILHAEQDKDRKWFGDAKENVKYVMEAETKHQAALRETLPLLTAVKTENIGLQQEIQYRSRIASVHADVKRRLDYLLETESAKRRMQHKHMVDWVVGQVQKSITPEKEKAFLAQCITDLQALSKKTPASA